MCVEAVEAFLCLMLDIHCCSSSECVFQADIDGSKHLFGFDGFAFRLVVLTMVFQFFVFDSVELFRASSAGAAHHRIVLSTIPVRADGVQLLIHGVSLILVALDVVDH